MRQATEQVIINAAAMDASIPPERVEAAIRLMRGETRLPEKPRAERLKEGLDEPLTGTEATQLLGVTARTVRRYAELGYIRTVGRGLAGVLTRYSRKSVAAFLEGDAGVVANPDYAGREIQTGGRDASNARWHGRGRKGGRRGARTAKRGGKAA